MAKSAQNSSEKLIPSGTCVFCECRQEVNDFPCPPEAEPKIAVVCSKCLDELQPDMTEVMEKVVLMHLKVGGCLNCDSTECKMVKIGSRVLN